MITKITNANLDEYIQLFRAAETALNLSEGEISTLELYFSRLGDLVKTNNTKFVTLPLDEPHFVINANTREIIIPEEFTKNGIAVAGDVIAENIFFEVDRYFDAQDLHNVSQIYIQWEVPAANNQVRKGISVPWCKDISNSDKLIFGWALTQEMVQYSGTIKLSVMFADIVNPEADVPQINYALNTKPAQAKIFGSLDYLSHKVYTSNPGKGVYDRLTNSDIGGVQANPPYFVANDADYNSYSIWATTADDNESNHVITVDRPVYLRAAANPSSYTASGESASVQMPLITLTWKNKEGGILGTSYYNTAIENPGNYVDNGLVLGLTLDKVINPNKLYYDESGNLYNSTDLASINFPAEAYEYYTYYKAESAGTYYVTGKSAINYTDPEHGKVSATSTEVSGPRWVFEEPVGDTLDARKTLDDTAGRNFEKGQTCSLTITIPNVDNSSAQQAKASYSIGLYKASSLTFKDQEAITKGVWAYDEVEEPVGTLIQTFTDSGEYPIDEEGYYYAKVQKSLNTSVVSKMSDIFWITEKPEAPIITSNPEANDATDINQLSNGIEVSVLNKIDDGKHFYKYEWSYRPSSDRQYQVIAGATLGKYIPKTAGNYKVTVTVFYNDGQNSSTIEDIIIYSLK